MQDGFLTVPVAELQGLGHTGMWQLLDPLNRETNEKCWLNSGPAKLQFSC